MAEPGLARRYAVALFEHASRRGALDRVEADLGATVELFRRERAFRDFMLSPEVLDEHKSEILGRALGSRLSPIALNFLHLLLKKRRFDHLEEIHSSLAEQLDAHRGVLKAGVTTAVELRPELGERLRSRLAALTGKTIEIAYRVDPALIGGVVVVLHDQLIDSSVRRELDRLREELLQVRVI